VVENQEQELVGGQMMRLDDMELVGNQELAEEEEEDVEQVVAEVDPEEDQKYQQKLELDSKQKMRILISQIQKLRMHQRS
jgi:hypothetical protein